MKNKIWRFLSYVLVAVLTAGITMTANLLFSETSKLDQLEHFLLTYHVDEQDKTKLEDAAANGMISAVGDRWSYYIPADQYAAFMENKNNAYVGIGVTVQAVEGGYQITAVAQGGSSQEAGLQPGDLLIEADGTSLADLPLEEGKKLIQGEEGTTVNLKILRQGQTLSYTVTRKTVKIQVATGKLLSHGVGYIKIANFNATCAQETIARIQELQQQGATSILFDVRFNGGGYAHEMIQLLDYLLPEGPLFRTEDYSGKTQVESSDAAFLDMPMAVLVNGESYSAAEFFAAALEEYDAAVVVGQQTSGKGYFQNTFLLNDGSAVAISTGKYCTPNGVSLEGVGITPEIFVEVDENMAAAIYAGTLAPEEDPQILAAINALKSAK